MTKLLIGHLTALAKAYAGHRSLSFTSLGVYAVNDSEFFDRLERGILRTSGYDKALTWFEANWPGELAWPKDVPRATAIPHAFSPSRKQPETTRS